MKLKNACEKYKWNESEIKFFVRHNVIGSDENGDAEIGDDDIDKICLINLFRQIGLEKEQVLKYFSPQTDKDLQIRLLRETRDNLLDFIHDRQKLLDKLDYILHQLQMEKKER